MNNNSSLLLLLSKINNKIPKWIKMFFRFLFIIILVLKLLGLSILDILSNLYYLKLYIIIICSLLIIYQFINIYLMYKISKKKTKIPEILPDFLIKFLKDYENVGQSKESFNYFKKMFYTEIFIYFCIIIFIILIF